MADSSLDDFFAKKDKSKKKPKGKAAVEEDSSAKLKKDKKKKEREKEKQTSSGGQRPNASPIQEDEEWKDYEEVKKVDYSGLRIQNLQISKEDQDRDGAESGDHGDDEDENRDRRDGASGPWNKSNAPAPAAAPVLASPTEPIKEETQTPKAAGKYVPPAQRKGATPTPSATSLPSSRKKKDAPNVNSEEDFPTLGGAVSSGKGSSNPYSSASSSDLIDNANQRAGINLTLENKFSALQD